MSKRMVKKQSIVPGPRVPISDIPEVQAVEDIKQEIAELRAQFPEAFLRLAELADKYNMALEEAEKIVRGRVISCGPFENVSVSVKFDAEQMYDELGEEMFLKHGGKIENKAVYSIDREKVLNAIAKEEIPEESVEHFRSVSPSFRKPEKLKVP